jgi:hypothetical protein
MNQVENIAYNKISNENSVILENGFMTIDGYELEQLYQLFSSIEEKFGFYPNISQINSNGIIISINGLLTNDAKLTLKREIL